MALSGDYVEAPGTTHGPLFMFIVRSYKIYENIRSNYKLLITLGPLLDGAEYLTTRLVFHQLHGPTPPSCGVSPAKSASATAAAPAPAAASSTQWTLRGN